MGQIAEPLNENGLELRRILASATFAHSDALRRLLAYLGEKSLAGEGSGLKEYTIGVEAFGKPDDYNPQEDPTVRVLASKLRHKLEDYYRTEGHDSAVRIELPKGHYRLEFLRRAPESAASWPPAASAEVRKWRRICWLLSAALVAVAVIATVWAGLLLQNRTATARGGAAWTPELELIWRPYLEGNRPVLIALGTPLFTKFAQGFFRDPRLNLWEEAEGSERLREVQKALGSSYASPSYNYTGVGEASGTFLLTRLLAPRRPNLLLKRSAAFSWEDLSTHNAIFLGSPKYIPRLKDIPFQQDFVIEGGSLHSLRPQPGEPREFPEVWTPNHAAILEDFALVTHLPGLHGRGEITVLAASSTEGTWAATEYVTNPSHAKELVARLGAVRGRLPEAYQVVVHAVIKDGVPIGVKAVAHRVLRPLGTRPEK
jgi:hypothetical protein